MIYDTLVEFGVEFQRKCVTALLDKTFLEQVFDIVQPSYFESESHKWMVKTILWYYQQHHDVATKVVFISEGQKLVDEVLKVDVKFQLQTIFRDLTPSDLEYVKDVFLEFCKTLAMKHALEKGADLLMAGKRDEIKGIVDGAYSAGLRLDLGHDYFGDIEDRLKEDFRHTIPTPWKVLNATMKGGGIGRGELACVMAASGMGKSWFLCAVGLEAVKQGKRVVHVTLEMLAKETGNRYDALLTGINANDIPMHAEAVRREVLALRAVNGGHLHIPFYPGGSITANTILGILQELKLKGTPADIVIVDYADKLRSVQKAKEKYQELGFIYDELVSVFQRMEVVGWTATQAQRSATSKEVVEADNIAESFAKMYSTTFMMTLSRRIADKTGGTGRIHIAKNRFGRDGQVFPCRINYDQGIIEIYEDGTPEGTKIRELVANAEHKQKAVDRLDLRKKWVDQQQRNTLDEALAADGE